MSTIIIKKPKATMPVKTKAKPNLMFLNRNITLNDFLRVYPQTQATLR